MLDGHGGASGKASPLCARKPGLQSGLTRPVGEAVCRGQCWGQCQGQRRAEKALPDRSPEPVNEQTDADLRSHQAPPSDHRLLFQRMSKTSPRFLRQLFKEPFPSISVSPRQALCGAKQEVCQGNGCCTQGDLEPCFQGAVAGHKVGTHCCWRSGWILGGFHWRKPGEAVPALRPRGQRPSGQQRPCSKPVAGRREQLSHHLTGGPVWPGCPAGEQRSLHIWDCPGVLAWASFPHTCGKAATKPGERGDRASGQWDRHAGQGQPTTFSEWPSIPRPSTQLKPGQKQLRGRRHTRGSTGDTPGGRAWPGSEGTVERVLTALEQRRRPEEPLCGQGPWPGSIPATDRPSRPWAGSLHWDSGPFSRSAASFKPFPHLAATRRVWTDSELPWPEERARHALLSSVVVIITAVVVIASGLPCNEHS